MKTIVILTGETSGDTIASHLIRELQERAPGAFTFYGVTGPQMRAAGCHTWQDQNDLNVMGLAEVIPHIPKILRIMGNTTKNILALNPDMVIGVDAPDFTLRIMKKLKKAREQGKIKSILVHYVAPSVWAWKAYRAKTLAHTVDHLLCLYPFEPPYFTVHGLPTTCTGHPVLQTELPKKHPREDTDPLRIGLLPGSRGQELKALLPLFQDVAARLAAERPNASFVMLAAPSVAQRLKDAVAGWTTPVDIIDDPAKKTETLASMDLALAASGTITLELAWARVPTVVTYRVSPITAWLVRQLVRVQYASLINILTNQPIFPEYIQGDATVDHLTHAMMDLLPPEKRQERVQAIETALLGLSPTHPPEKPSAVAAQTILGLLAPSS
jgi:lipid-A-disaccharide synthase